MQNTMVGSRLTLRGKKIKGAGEKEALKENEIALKAG